MLHNWQAILILLVREALCTRVELIQGVALSLVLLTLLMALFSNHVLSHQVVVIFRLGTFLVEIGVELVIAVLVGVGAVDLGGAELVSCGFELALGLQI